MHLLKVFLFFSLVFAPASGFAAAAEDLREELRPFLETPFVSGLDAIDRLKGGSEILLQHEDRRAIFMVSYFYSSLEMQKFIDADRFQHPEWFKTLMVHFTNLYRAAIWAELNEDHAAVPPAWEMAFHRNDDRDVSPVLLQMISANAHISRDLPYAILSSAPDWSDRSYKKDYAVVSGTFAAAIAHTWQVLEHFGGGTRGFKKELSSEFVRSFILSKRAIAWRQAHKLAHMSEAGRQKALRKLEKKVVEKAEHYLCFKDIIR